MNCNTCGANLPPGAAQCPVCGTPTPYNTAGSGSGGSPQYDPTVVASPPQYGTPPTAYGAPSYGTPSSSDPYSGPSYGTPPPPPQNQYPAPGYGQYVQPGTYGGGIQAPPPRRRSRVGLIIAIVAAVLVLACIGICGALYVIGKNAGNSIQATVTTIASTASTSNNVTPTTSDVTPTTSTANAPSGVSIDATAAGYITNPKMSSAVDSTSYMPTSPTTTFKVNQTIYATFKVAASAPKGYVTGKWYSNGDYAFSSDPLESKGSGGEGYLAARYDIPTNGIVELYWCTQRDCSDARLAQVVNFTVSSTSMRSTGQPVAMWMPLNRPE